MNRVSPPYPQTTHPPTTAGAAGSTRAEFCGLCGEPSDGGALAASSVHRRCVERLAMEPPRYCAACRRRMKVQVTPTGWSAECSRHGMLAP